MPSYPHPLDRDQRFDMSAGEVEGAVGKPEKWVHMQANIGGLPHVICKDKHRFHYFFNKAEVMAWLEQQGKKR
jgi:hypothetical protein